MCRYLLPVLLTLWPLISYPHDVIVNRSSYLRAEPNREAEILEELDVGDGGGLLKLEPVNGYYQVLHEAGVGWLWRNNVTIYPDYLASRLDKHWEAVDQGRQDTGQSAAAAETFSSSAFCRALDEFSARVNQDVPATVDGITRLDGLSVQCAAKTIDILKSVNVPTSDLLEGWQERKQAQWNRSHCSGPWVAAIQNGWTVVNTTTFPDGTRHDMVAKCD